MEKSKLQKAEGPTLISPRNLQTSSCSCKRLENGEFGRNLVVCIDGTANKFGMQNTNVVELYSRLIKDDTQLTYYNSGIGTHAGKAKPSFLTRAFEMAIGRNIENNVLDAYEWLSENYKEGDRIYLFGFSRGAYQVRIIAGMIEKVGLLHKGNKQQIPFAYDLYIKLKAKQRRQEPTGKQSSEGTGTKPIVHRIATSLSKTFPRAVATAIKHKSTKKQTAIEYSKTVCQSFKRTLSHTGVKVHFVGCWDTVSSVGVVRRESLPETTTGMAHVCVFRHALALDELRVKFLPEYVNGGEGPQHGNTSVEVPTPKQENRTKPDATAQPEHTPKTTKGNVKEVWFAGCHSDVGGGNIENLDANKFGPALRWMTYEGITWGLRMTPFDQAWQPLYPQSSMTFSWKLLEYMVPFRRLSYTGPNDVTRSLHKQAPRCIMPGQLIHESVRDSNTGSMPKPLACFPKGSSLSWDHWDSLQNITEHDPYIKPSTVLDRIQKATAGHQITSGTKERFGLEADYDVLYTASLQEIGLRVIRERRDAETILASALAYEIGTFDRTSERIPEHISTIAKTLDRCFSLIPRKPIEVVPDVQVVFDKLFENNPDARLKFLYHFATLESRQSIAKAEIKRHMDALQGSAEAGFSSGRIHSIKALALALLNLLMVTSSDDEKSYSYPEWMDGIYTKLTSFHDLSTDHRVNAVLDFLNFCIEENQGRERGHLDIRVTLLKEIQRYAYPVDDGPTKFNAPEEVACYLNVLFGHAYELQTPFDDIEANMDTLNQIISFYTQYRRIQQRPEDFLLNNLATALYTRFEKGGEQSDIEESIALYKQALELRPPPHPDRSASLNNLASALSTRFKQGGGQSDLVESITLYKQALELQPPPHPDRSASLNNLAIALLIRFKQGGEQSDIDESIAMHRQALESRPPPHPDRSASLNNLATALYTRFEKGGEQSDIEESIALYNQALELRPPPHPNRSASLNSLANALLTRFAKGGEQSDIEESIALYRQALELRPPPHPDGSMALDNLANALSTRFEKGGGQSDIEESIALHRQALELRPPPHPDRSALLYNLANALSTRFEEGGEQSDIEESIALVREALELRPTGHPERLDGLNELGYRLWSRFDRYGKQSDIDESINLLTEAFDLQIPNDPDWVYMLDTFAVALHSRFERAGGERADIEKAISLHEKAVVLTSQADSEIVHNFANALRIRFEHGGEPSDIDKSIRLFKEALELVPAPHRHRPGALDKLANAFEARYNKDGQQSDLDEAKALREEAQTLRNSYG